MKFKRPISLFMVLLLVCSLTCCGDTKVINGHEYDTYGLINADSNKNPSIEYKPIWGNIIWGCILFETIIGPIYFFGYSMFEPVRIKPACYQKEVIR